MRYRVEVIETETTVRQTYIEADSDVAARQAAEAQDWREWETIDHSSDSGIEMVEEAPRE